MTAASRRRWTAVTGAMAAGALIAWIALRPAAVPVDVVAASRGPLTVTLDEEGETRVHDRFVVAAPVAGTLERIDLHAGDAVAAGQVIARIRPAPLGPREREAQLARVAAVEALAREAAQQLRHAEQDAAQAAREDERLAALVRQGLVARQDADRARIAAVTSVAEVESARQRARAATAEVRVARSGLIGSVPGEGGSAREIRVASPVDGLVLAIPEVSARTVEAGAPLVVLGDPRRMEVMIEMLSGEAVRIRPGMLASLEGWGGEQPLPAIVRHIEPHAFTKVSALGVEEKRTRVILDLPQIPPSLGDGYRVTARIVETHLDATLKAPLAALHRCGSGAWCVFVVSEGKARERQVDAGVANQDEAAIAGGLAPGELVVTHAPNELRDGSRVAVRRN